MSQTYRVMEAWIYEDEKIIFVGYEQKLHEIFKNADKEKFIIIRETSQKRLGSKIVDFARKQKGNEEFYYVEKLSVLNTLNNIIRYFYHKEFLFTSNKKYDINNIKGGI